MKRLLIAFFIFGMISSVQSYAGDEPLKRPNNIGIEKFDTFKNESFDIYIKTYKLRQVVDGDKQLSPEQVAGLAKIKTDVERLLKKGEQILKEGKNINPKTKSLKAIANTKKSIDALKKTTEHLNHINKKIAEK